MMKSKLLALGLIALVLAGGLLLASCGNKCVGGFTSGGKGLCDLSKGKDCSDLCVSTQAVNDRYSKDNYKCNC